MSTIISSKDIRKRILEMAFAAQSVHVPSAFSIVEILRVLHNEVLRYPNNDPHDARRDVFVLSKGHGVMALYAILEDRGWITSLDIQNYFGDGSRLPGLCEAVVPGCEANSGSLGQGIGVAAGNALALRIRNDSSRRVYCLVGDGELNEGSTFEALSFVGQQKLTNFALIVDLNGFQAMGKTDHIISQRYLGNLLKNIGFDVIELDGHDEIYLAKNLKNFAQNPGTKPVALLAKTTKGRGVSFMEDENDWHYKRLSKSDFERALEELK